MEGSPNQPPSRYRLVIIGLALGVAFAVAVAVQDCGGSIQRRAGDGAVAVAE